MPMARCVTQYLTNVYRSDSGGSPKMPVLGLRLFCRQVLLFEMMNFRKSYGALQPPSIGIRNALTLKNCVFCGKVVIALQSPHDE